MIHINNTLKLLGFEDLNIKELKIDESLTEFHIYVLLGKEKHKCPQCQTMNDSLHSYYEMIINHKHFVGKNCFIHFKRKRLKCLKCKKTFLEPNPFAKMQTKISDETVFSVLRELKQNQSFADVAKK